MDIVPGQSFVIPLLGLPLDATQLIMSWIVPGIFLMGSPEDETDRIAEEEAQFQVTFSHGFWLGKFLVTQAQWQAVMGNNPSHFHYEGQDHPVENVSWYDAIAFSQVVGQQLRTFLPLDYVFRVPTEAEWEYACRSGTQMVYYSGYSSLSLSSVAWHAENSNGCTHPVGQKAPNMWGLYDMHGNVFEWCYDATSSYPSVPMTDWVGVENEYVRSLRSSSYATPSTSTSFRCACRGYVEPETKRAWIGFRLCLSI